MKRKLTRLTMVVSVLLLIPILLVWLSPKSETTRKIEALRDAGMPTDLRELDAWYPPVPDGQNSAVIMTQAFDWLRKTRDERTESLPYPSLQRKAIWSDEVREQIKFLIATNSVALDKAAEAVLRPRCRYAVDFKQDTSPDLPHLGPIKALAAMSAFRAVLAAEKGQREECGKDLKLILNLAKTLENEPSAVSQGTYQWLNGFACRALERCANTCELDETAWGELRIAFSTCGTNTVLRALASERAMAIHLIDGGAWQSGSRFFDVGVRSMGIFDKELRFFLTAFETNLALAQLDPPASLALVKLTDAQEKTAISNRFSFARSGIQACGVVAMKQAHMLARTRVAQTALAIEQFRLRHKRLPETLEQLCPELFPAVLLDPFDGKPLRYRQLPKGYVVYSVGEDGMDQGGLELAPRSPVPAEDGKQSSDVNVFAASPSLESTNRPAYDVTFTVER